MRKCFLIVLFCCVTLHAQDMKSRARKLFSASVAAVSAAAIADAGTSWGKAETNPVLGQCRFGLAQTGIKMGLVSSALAGQFFLMHHRNTHAAAGFAAVNFASAGVLGAIAWHNSKVPKMPN